MSNLKNQGWGRQIARCAIETLQSCDVYDSTIYTVESAQTLFRDADLTGAQKRLVARLRTIPGDAETRIFLFQLLCIGADWGGATAQLRILAGQVPDAQMLAAAYLPTMEAMTARAKALAGHFEISLLARGDKWTSALVHTADRRGAFATAPDTPGEVDGRRFDFLFDGDGRFGPSIEAIVGGRWGLIPFAAIASIDTEGPVDLRDLVWLPAEIRLRDGRGFAALLPVTYPGSSDEADPAFRLARRTEWRERDGVVHGVGQRVWTTDTGEDVPILEFRRIRFDATS